MNKIILLFSVVLIFSCKASDEDLMDVVNDPSSDIETTLLIEGSFTGSAHPTSGTVQILEDNAKKYVQFKNFKSDNGPDLKVYLSTSKRDNDFINLGELKSINGDFFYEIPKDTDHEKYNYVLIWCKAFSVLFGSAECS